MESDPSTWTVAEVQQFFRQDAANVLGIASSGPLLDPFLQALQDNDVDGASLLSDVDAAALRDDFGIPSFKTRGTIMRCIRKLRSQCATLLSGEHTDPQTPTSLATPQFMPQPTIENIDTVQMLEPIGEHVRAHEHEIRDAQGRKRRKIAPALEAPKPTQMQDLDTGPISYLRDDKFPIDEIFYGRTGLGCQVGDFATASEIVALGDDAEAQEQNFQFVASRKTIGEAAYVHASLKHFFNAKETHEVSRRDRSALAVLPYREHMQKNARSAMVLQYNSEDAYIVVREHASLLHNEYGYGGEAHSSNAEWDFLFHHQDTQHDEVLPAWGQSGSEDTGDDEDVGSNTNSDADKVEVDDEAVDDGSFLSRERVSELVHLFIQECIAKWTEKQLPKLEATKAWSVWKKLRGSKSERDRLTAIAKADIESYNKRLKRLKEEPYNQQWQSESDFAQFLRVLEPTVEVIEEQKWMISVWQRRKEPDHTIKSRSSVRYHHQTDDHGQAYATLPGSKQQPNDRLSVSPTPATRGVLAIPLDEDDRDAVVGAPDEGGDEFHSAVGSPFVVSTDDADSETADETSYEVSYEADPDAGPEDEAAEPGSLTSNPPCSPSMAAQSPTAKAEPAFGQHAPSQHVAASPNDSPSDELPSPSTFVKLKFSQGARFEPATPTKTTKHASTQAIDLTMSSDELAQKDSSDDSSPPTKRRLARSSHKKSKAKPFVSPDDVYEATAKDVAAWDIYALAKGSDRNRVLVKLLHQAGPPFMAELVKRLDIGFVKFRAQLRCALRAIGSKDLEAEGVDENAGEVLMQCARFAVIWHSSAYLDVELHDLPWKPIHDDTKQLDMFLQILRDILMRRKTKLFATSSAKPRSTPSAKPTSSSNPYVISDDDDDDGMHHSTPHRKRKRPVEQSQVAAASRISARARAARRQQAQADSQDASQLEAIIASDPRNSTVEINLEKEPGQDPIYIHSTIAQKMKAHQIEGVRFMWSEVTDKGDEGAQGCILAHTMGLGKTMQAIALLIAIKQAAESSDPNVRDQLPAHLRPKGLRKQRSLRMMILCPPSLLQNWRREIGVWAGDQLGHIFTVDVGNKALSRVEQWHRHGGVMLIGYSLFRSLVSPKKGQTEESALALTKYLLESAEIAVADEAHNLKNETSGIAMAASRLQTHSRIGLTGTPMSNDVQEIYALVSWAAPGFFGTSTQFKARFTEPIQAGNHKESTGAEVRRMLQKLVVLRREIGPKVDRADITVLMGTLRPKVEFVLFVPLTPLQVTAYKRCVAALTGKGGIAEQNETLSQTRMWSWLAVLMLLTNHPLCFKRKLLAPPAPKKQTVRTQTPTTDSGSTTPAPLAEVTTMEELIDASIKGPVPGEEDAHALGFTKENVQTIIEGISDAIDPAQSAKTAIFMQILEHSRECGDKMLVFSMSIPTLDYLEELVESQDIRCARLDGSIAMPKRTQLLEDFHKGHFDVMLISTKAGGVGLNIACANRVVIFDFGFNPTWEEQAIGRAYRLGQTKPVFVYRFVASGTFESNIYNKQLYKTGLASRVVDKKNPRRNAERNVRDYLYEPREPEQEDLGEWIGKDPNVLDKLLESHGPPEEGKVDTLIRGVKTMETLQEDAKDPPLTEEETKAADLDYEEGMKLKTGRRAGMAARSSLSTEARTSVQQMAALTLNGLPAQTQQPSVHRPQASHAAPTFSATMPGQVYAPAPQQQQHDLPLGGLPIVSPQPHHSALPRPPQQ